MGAERAADEPPKQVMEHLSGNPKQILLLKCPTGGVSETQLTVDQILV